MCEACGRVWSPYVGVCNPCRHRAERKPLTPPPPRVQVFFVWWAPLVGGYWDRKGRVLYLVPLPCLALALDLGKRGPR